MARRHEHAFDLNRYWLDFANNNVVDAYRVLLSAYAMNSDRTNYIVVSLLEQVPSWGVAGTALGGAA